MHDIPFLYYIQYHDDDIMIMPTNVLLQWNVLDRRRPDGWLLYDDKMIQ